MACASSSAARCARDWCGLDVASTLRLTSPQAASVSSSAASIPFMAVFRFDLMTPWNWNVWRVVRRSVPLA